VSSDGSDLLAGEMRVTAFNGPLWGLSGGHIIVGLLGYVTAFNGPLWSLPVLGGSPRRLGEIVASGAAWSPDGKTLAYTSVI
jgi:hypothetical protein